MYHTAAPTISRLTSGFNKTGHLLFNIASWFLTFQLVTISWVFFRAKDVGEITTALNIMLLTPVKDTISQGLTFIPYAGIGEQMFYVVLIGGAIVAQLIYRDEPYNWTKTYWFRGVRGATSLALMVILYPSVKEQFIYFQF